MQSAIAVLKWSARLLTAGAGLYIVTFLAVSGFTYGWSNPANPEPADVIVCLGAGMDPDGTLHPPAVLRVETCVALYRTGVAPRIHFTGGRAIETGPSAGERMAALAKSMGIPDAVISFENRSLSTLQNAYFSQPMLMDANRLILVTEGFHLPRSRMSFWLFGPHEIDLYMSNPIRLRADGTWEWRMIQREAAAIWFNGLRFGAWWIGGRMGVEGHDQWLD